MSSCVPFLLFGRAASPCIHAQRVTAAAVMNSSRCADWSPWLPLPKKKRKEKGLFLKSGDDFWGKVRNKKNSNCFCVCCENTSFIWCQRACVALSSVQIWWAASFLAPSKHHGPPSLSPPLQTKAKESAGGAAIDWALINRCAINHSCCQTAGVIYGPPVVICGTAASAGAKKVQLQSLIWSQRYQRVFCWGI